MYIHIISFLVNALNSVMDIVLSKCAMVIISCISIMTNICGCEYMFMINVQFKEQITCVIINENGLLHLANSD